MKNFASIVTRINSSVWLMTEDGIKQCLSILERHMHEDEDEIRRQIGLFFDEDANDNRGPQVVNGVGVLSLEGPIFPKANLMTELSGATSLESFRSDFRAMLADDSISSIILNIDSPGGVSDLVMETAREIREGRDVKPIFTIANTMACSAAFWLAAQGTESYVTDSGITGSLGVYTVHMDTSEQERNRGIVKTVIQAGDAKAGGEQPLNEHTRKNLQDMVDDCYADFVNEVAAGRNLDPELVSETFGQGGTLTPRQAVAVGAVDGIKTFESLLGESIQNGGVVGNSSAVAALKALTDRGLIRGYTMHGEHGKGVTFTFEPDLEHGDPGPNGEPIPREPQMEDDPAVTGGWRVPGELQPSFPPSNDQPPPNESNATMKGSAMDRDKLVALAERLNLSFAEDTSDDDLYAMITSEVDDVVVPLTQAAQAAERTRSFATDYPKEYALMQSMQERDEENEARVFASQWERFEIKDGETTKKSTHGFSGRVLSNIEDVSLKLTRKQLSQDDLATLLDSIAETGAVDYSEHGSARYEGEKPSVDRMSAKEVRDTFASTVNKIMVEDSVDRRTATRLVAERDPELAEAYKNGHLRK